MFFQARIAVLLIVLATSVDALAARITCSNALKAVQMALELHVDTKVIDVQLARATLKNLLNKLDPNRIYFDRDEANILENPDDNIVHTFMADFTGKNSLMIPSVLQERLATAKVETIEFLKSFRGLHGEIVKRSRSGKSFRPYEPSRDQAARLDRVLDFVTAIYIEHLRDGPSVKEAWGLAMREVFRGLGSATTVDPEVMPEMVASAMIKTLDPHSNFEGLDVYEAHNSWTKNSSVTVGLGMREGLKGFVVESVLKDGPAEKAGVKVGDVVRKFDGHAVLEMADEDIEKMGPTEVGQQVEIEVLRNSKVKKISLKAQSVDFAPSHITHKIVETPSGKIAEIRLTEFYNGASADMAERIEQLKKLGVKGLVLNLGGNGGGLLPEAIAIAGLFLGQKPVVGTASHSAQEVYFAENNAIWEGPLIVSINNASASASELVSGTLQDYGRAIVVGSSQTYGKGTVQWAFRLVQKSESELTPEISMESDQNQVVGGLSATQARFYRPSGKSTQLIGVQSQIVFPEIAIFMEKNYPNVLPTKEVPSLLTKDDIKIIPKKVLKSLRLKSHKRISQNAQWTKVVEENDWYALDGLYSQEALKILEDLMSQTENKN